MFRVGVAALVFVASFHPPVQSQRAHTGDLATAIATGRQAAGRLSSQRTAPAIATAGIAYSSASPASILP